MCCLFGLMDYGHAFTRQQRMRILSVLSVECEARGTDATGIAYNSDGSLHIYKRPAPAHKLHFMLPDDAHVIMGHTRLATQGSEKRNRNNHPFAGYAGKHFALAHNGVLYNDIELRRKYHLPRTRIQTDSYIAVQLIESRKALDFDSLRYMAEQVEGSFSFTVLDECGNLYFVKGDNPLCLYHYPESGVLMYASTEDILQKALNRLYLPLEKPEKPELLCGDILRVDANGTMTKSEFNADKLFYSKYFCGYMPTRCYDWSTEYGAERGYINELKAVAGAFGYSPEDVDLLLSEGVTPEELEEYFYCGEM